MDQTGIDTPRKRYAVSREALTAVQDASVTLLDGGVLSDEQFYRFGQEVILPWRGALIVVRQAFIDGRPAVVELHLDAAERLRAEGESFVAGVQYEGVE